MVLVPPARTIAERRVVAHLRRYGAVTPDKAMGYAPIRWSHARALARLRQAGVIRGEPNALWLDDGAWSERRAKRRKRALALLTVGALGAASAAFATLRG